jgi:hypothetical protein
MIARITLDIELDDIGPNGPIPLDLQRREAEVVAEGIAEGIADHAEAIIHQVALVPSPVDA